MVIKLETKEGLEFSFDTVAEFMEFKKKMDEEEASKELTSEPIEDTSDDEIEVPGTEPKLEAGDKVRVVSAEDGTETPYHHINIGSVVEVVSSQSHGGVEVVEDGVHQYLLPGHFEKVEPLGKDANGEDVEVVENEQEFKVGDKVRVVGNNYGHCMELGELREIKEVDPNEPKYNLSGSSCGYWAGTSDIEREPSSPKFQSGDVVKVTESFEDIRGDRVKVGAVYNYDELGEAFVGTVFLGDNEDKIELVCRAQDRLDKY